jgi:hypothetical protein
MILRFSFLAILGGSLAGFEDRLIFFARLLVPEKVANFSKRIQAAVLLDFKYTEPPSQANSKTSSNRC